MNATTFRCTLDIHDIYSQFCLRVKKRDTSGRLIITLMENGKPYHITENCYAVFACGRTFAIPFGDFRRDRFANASSEAACRSGGTASYVAAFCRHCLDFCA